MSEASIQKLKSIAAKVRAAEAIETSDDASKDKSLVDSASSDSKSKKAKVLIANINTNLIVI